MDGVQVSGMSCGSAFLFAKQSLVADIGITSASMDLLLAIAGASLLVLYGAAQCRRGGSGRKWLRQNCHVLVDGCMSRTSRPKGSQMRHASETDLVDRYVALYLRKKEGAEMSSTFAYTALLVTMCILIITINILKQTQRWLSVAQTCILFLWQGISLVVLQCFPRAIQRRPGLAHAALMFELCVMLLFSDSVVGFLLSELSATPCRVTASLRYYSMPSITLWNCMYTAVGVFVSYRVLPGDVVSPVLVYQVWSLVILLPLSMSVGNLVKADVRRQVESSILRGECSGLWGLLDMVCDVVVPLDESLAIVDLSERFAALVTMQGGSMRGAKLQDYMPDATDQQALEKWAHGPGCDLPGDLAAALPPCTLRVKLRDCLGNRLSVDLFCVGVQTLVQRRYLVGIREVADAQPLPDCVSFPPPRVRRTDRVRGPSRGAPPHPEAFVFGSSSARGGAPSEDARSSASSHGSTDDSVGGFAAGPDSPSPSVAESQHTAAEPSVEAGGGGGVAGPPGIPATSAMGLRMALVQLLSLVVVEPRQPRPRTRRSQGGGQGGACCPFHQRVARCLLALRDLQDMGCTKDFEAVESVQCSDCGLLFPPASMIGDGPSQAHGTKLCFACQGVVDDMPLHSRLSL